MKQAESGIDQFRLASEGLIYRSCIEAFKGFLVKQGENTSRNVNNVESTLTKKPAVA